MRRDRVGGLGQGAGLDLEHRDIAAREIEIGIGLDEHSLEWMPVLDRVAHEVRTFEDECSLVPTIPAPVRQPPQPLHVRVASGEPLAQLRP